jgi:hypothetical protein
LAWLTGGDLMDRVKAVLAIEQMDSPTNWTTVCADAAARAAADIRGVLSNRGFSGAQIAAWDSLVAFNASQGLFWALTLGGATKDFDDTFIKQLDVREQLATVNITVGEEDIDPANPPVAGGELSTDADAFKTSDADLARWRDAAGNVSPGNWPWR